MIPDTKVVLFRHLPELEALRCAKGSQDQLHNSIEVTGIVFIKI